MSKDVFTERQFDDMLTGMLGAGGWFQIHMSLILKFGADCAVALHYLINYHQRMKRSRGYVWDDGWFYCTVEKMRKELGFERDKQQRILCKLSKRKYRSGTTNCDGEGKPVLEWSKRGLPARRHIRLNAKLILEIVNAWECRADELNDDDTPVNVKSRSPYNRESRSPYNRESRSHSNKLLSNKDEYVNPSDLHTVANGDDVPVDGFLPSNNHHQNGQHSNSAVKPSTTKTPTTKTAATKPNRPKPTTKKRTPRQDLLTSSFDKKAAAHLRSILVANDSDLVNGLKAVRMDTLSKMISRLRTERKVPESDITAMLNWLEKHYTDDYMPQIRAANDLMNKWELFRNAKRRNENDEKARDPERCGEQAQQVSEYAVLQMIYKLGGWEEFGIGKHYNSKQLQDAVDSVLRLMGKPPGSVSGVSVHNEHHFRKNLEIQAEMPRTSLDDL